MTEEEKLNRFLLVEMCRTQKLMKNGVESGTRVFHVLLSDVFHKIEEIFGKGTNERKSCILHISEEWNVYNPELNHQSIDLKKYIYSIISENTGKSL